MAVTHLVALTRYLVVCTAAVRDMELQESLWVYMAVEDQAVVRVSLSRALSLSLALEAYGKSDQVQQQ